MERREYDVVIVGAGTAGLSARRAAAASGARTLLVNAGRWGTTCVRSGCMPSKLLLAAAKAARDANRASAFGVEVGSVRVDLRAVMTRMQSERERFLRSIHDELDHIPDTGKMEGHARFTGLTTLQVDDKAVVQANAVVIATGARSLIPAELQQVRDRVLTSETMFDLEDLPRSIAVIGAGPLGIELGAAFTRLGVRTALFDRGTSLGGLKDADVSSVARGIFEAELDLRLETDIEVERSAEGVTLQWNGPSGTGKAAFEWVLAAAGRTPDLQGLDLAAAGLPLNDQGVPAYDRATLRCGDSAVFIAGDANHDRPVLHEANREGRIAGANAARFPDMRAEAPNAALSIVFTDPDMAAIGQPLSELGDNAAVGCCDFGAGRGLIDGRSQGMIRLYVRRDTKIVAGGEMVGPVVEHLAHLVGFMVQQKVTADAALGMPFYHPTYEEDLKNCLRDLLKSLG